MKYRIFHFMTYFPLINLCLIKQPFGISLVTGQKKINMSFDITHRRLTKSEFQEIEIEKNNKNK